MIFKDADYCQEIIHDFRNPENGSLFAEMWGLYFYITSCMNKARYFDFWQKNLALDLHLSMEMVQHYVNGA